MNFDPVEFIMVLNRRKVRYLLIGRQAVVQYGAPLFSFDYDFWIDPGDRNAIYEIASQFELIGRYSALDMKPADSFTDDEGNKVDAFFVGVFSKKGMTLAFDDVYGRSVSKADPDSDFFVRIPSIDDLIDLKRLGDMRPKDLEDIEYLETIKEKGVP
jgi:hypothetical protein